MLFIGMPVFPGTDANLGDLIKYYYQQMYTEAEIRTFFMLRHGRDISKKRLRRTILALRLRRNKDEAPSGVILQGIMTLFEAGFRNAGYRVILRLLNVNFQVRATQATVQRLVKLIDPEGVILRRGHRLHRRIYKNGGPDCILHIDGYDKLKLYGFSIHGRIFAQIVVAKSSQI